MIDTIVPDKDGISALGCLSLVIHHVYTQGMNLRGYLETIYQRYGYFYTINSYYFSHSPAVTRSIFDRIRNYYATSCDTSDNQSTNNTYPKCIGVFRVDAVRDLTTGYDSTQPDCKAKLPTSKSSQMITFQVSHHSFTASLTLRTSGTEPKIKYYSEMTVDYDRRLEIEGMLSQLIKSVAEELLEPEKNGLVPKSL